MAEGELGVAYDGAAAVDAEGGDGWREVEEEEEEEEGGEGEDGGGDVDGETHGVG